MSQLSPSVPPTSLTALCPGKCWKFLEVLESCGAAGGTSWLCGKRRAMGDSYCKPESSCLFLSDQHVIFTSRQSSWSHPSCLESLHPKITLGFICSAPFPGLHFPRWGQDVLRTSTLTFSQTTPAKGSPLEDKSLHFIFQPNSPGFSFQQIPFAPATFRRTFTFMSKSTKN